jgi:hypothetical protein
MTSVSGLMVYPNPFTETTTLDYNLNKAQSTTIILTDVLGRHVTEWNNKSEAGGNHLLSINASELQLSAGIYFLKFQTENKAAIIKLILNR